MNIDVPDEAVIEGIARAFERFLNQPAGAGAEVAGLLRMVGQVTLARQGLLTKDQVAAFAQVSGRTVERWVEDGELARQDLPGDRMPRFLFSDVLAMLAPGHRATAAQAAPITAAARSDRREASLPGRHR